jgi:hypothetical protein
MYWAVAWLPRYDLEDYGLIRDRMLIFVRPALPRRRWEPQSRNESISTRSESSASEV